MSETHTTKCETCGHERTTTIEHPERIPRGVFTPVKEAVPEPEETKTPESIPDMPIGARYWEPGMEFAVEVADSPNKGNDCSNCALKKSHRCKHYACSPQERRDTGDIYFRRLPASSAVASIREIINSMRGEDYSKWAPVPSVLDKLEERIDAMPREEKTYSREISADRYDLLTGLMKEVESLKKQLAEVRLREIEARGGFEERGWEIDKLAKYFYEEDVEAGQWSDDRSVSPADTAIHVMAERKAALTIAEKSRDNWREQFDTLMKKWRAERNELQEQLTTAKAEGVAEGIERAAGYVRELRPDDSECQDEEGVRGSGDTDANCDKQAFADDVLYRLAADSNPQPVASGGKPPTPTIPLAEHEKVVGEGDRLAKKLANQLLDSSEEARRLRYQLPESMQDCTIKFIECEQGHGRLVATNWVDSGCPYCQLADAEAERDAAHRCISGVERKAERTEARVKAEVAEFVRKLQTSTSINLSWVNGVMYVCDKLLAKFAPPEPETMNHAEALVAAFDGKRVRHGAMAVNDYIYCPVNYHHLVYHFNDGREAPYETGEGHVTREDWVVVEEQEIQEQTDGR